MITILPSCHEECITVRVCTQRQIFDLLMQACTILLTSTIIVCPILDLHCITAICLLLVVCIDWSTLSVLVAIQLVVSWTAHIVIFSYHFMDFVESFNVTVQTVETLLPELKPKLDNVYADIKSFAKSTLGTYLMGTLYTLQFVCLCVLAIGCQ